MAKSRSKPVWLNRDTELYVVVTDANSYFVLTDKGPVRAGHMVFEKTGQAIKKSQQWPYPLLVPDISEVVDLVDSASTLAQKSDMTMYRFLMGTDTCLVWTGQSEPQAKAFAELTMKKPSHHTYVVTNPLIIDTSFERVLATA